MLTIIIGVVCLIVGAALGMLIGALLAANGDHDEGETP